MAVGALIAGVTLPTALALTQSLRVAPAAGAQLTSGELAQNGSFEAGVSPWVPGNNTGFGIYANGQISPSDAAYAGTHYAAMNTSSPGGGLYEDIGGLSISPGDTFCGSAQVRDQLQETGARGSFVVWLIGGSSNEAGSDVFSNLGNGPNWSQVSTCVTATSSHTQVRIQFYPTPGTPTLDVDAVDVHHALQVAAPLTQNGGFESGPAPWQVGSNSNYVVYANGQIAPNDVAFAGSHYAATNTSAPGGGFYQDITGQSISPGDTVCGSARVRDQLQETGAQGSFVIWLIGGSSNESGVANFSNLGNGANWQPVSTCVTASTAHTQVRVQFFPTPGTPTLDVDAVVANDYRDIQESISQNGSFEAGASPWVPGNNTGFGIYANGQISPSDAAYAGTHYAAMNTSSPGGGLYEDIAGLSIAPGDTFCGSAESTRPAPRDRGSGLLRRLAHRRLVQRGRLRRLLQPRQRSQLDRGLHAASPPPAPTPRSGSSSTRHRGLPPSTSTRWRRRTCRAPRPTPTAHPTTRARHRPSPTRCCSNPAWPRRSPPPTSTP